MVIASDSSARRPEILTFYSYKGGTGRTMALANVAWILASQGRRVLLIDWDLEAPGLHRYFAPLLDDPSLEASDGLIDFLFAYQLAASRPPGGDEVQGPNWFQAYADIVRYARPVLVDFPDDGAIDLVGAGRQGPSYAERVNTFDWAGFYARFGGGPFLDAVFEQLGEDYDYVLIDSRTGVSDTAGICTVQLPDRLVVFFTLNNQSIEGASAIARDAKKQRQLQGRPLAVFPVPSRIDLSENDKLETRRALLRRHFDGVLDDAAVAPQDRASYFSTIELLYVPFYSYEEQLAAIVDRVDQQNTLLHAFEGLTSYLTDGAVRELGATSELTRRELRSRYDALIRAEFQTGPEDEGLLDDGTTKHWDVYISHATEDEELARALARSLRGRCRVALIEDLVLPGDKIAEVVAAGVWGSRVTAVLWTDPAAASSWVERELECGIEAATYPDAKLVPVLVGPRHPELPEALRELSALRLRGPKGVDAVADSILALLGDVGRAGEGPGAAKAQAQAKQAAGPSAVAAAPSASRFGGGKMVLRGVVVLVALVLVVAGLWWLGGPDRKLHDHVELSAIASRAQAELHWRGELRNLDRQLSEEQGRRAELLARTGTGKLEALVLGIQAAGPYITVGRDAPLDAGTGLLAALLGSADIAASKYVLDGTAELEAIAFSPAGEELAAVGARSSSLWEVKTGRVLDTPKAGAELRALAFSGDGELMATGGADGKVTVSGSAWSEPQTIETDAPVSALRFSAKGRRLIVLNGEPREPASSGSVWSVDAEGSKPLDRSISLRAGRYDKLAVSADGSRLAYMRGSTVEVIGIGERSTATFPRQDQVVRLELAPDGSKLALIRATGASKLDGGTGEVRIHDLETGRIIYLSIQSPDTAMVRFTPDGARVLLAFAGGAEDRARVELGVHDARTGVTVSNFRDPPGLPVDLAFSPDGSRVAIVDDSLGIWIWDVETGQRYAKLADFERPARVVAFAPDGRYLATGHVDGTARIWEAKSRDAQSLRGHDQPATLLSFAAGPCAPGDDCVRALVSANDNEALVWDVDKGELVGRVRVSEASIEAVALAPDGRSLALGLASGRGSGGVKLFTRGEDGEWRARELGRGRPVRALAFFADGEHLLVGDEGGQGRIVDLGADGAKPELRVDFEGAVSAVATARERDAYVLASWERELSFGTLAADSPGSQRISQSARTVLGFDAAGERVAAAGKSGLLLFEGGEAQGTERVSVGGGDALASLAFADPETLLIITDEGDFGWLRTLGGSPELLADLDPGERGTAFAIHPDGSVVARATNDRVVQVFPARPRDWLTGACERVRDSSAYMQVSYWCDELLASVDERGSASVTPTPTPAKAGGAESVAIETAPPAKPDQDAVTPKSTGARKPTRDPTRPDRPDPTAQQRYYYGRDPSKSQ